MFGCSMSDEIAMSQALAEEVPSKQKLLGWTLANVGDARLAFFHLPVGNECNLVYCANKRPLHRRRCLAYKTSGMLSCSASHLCES